MPRFLITSFFVLLLMAGCDSINTNLTSGGFEIPVLQITGVSVLPLDRVGNDHFYTDTLRNQLVFSVYTEADTVAYAPAAGQWDAESRDDLMPGKVSNRTEMKYAAIRFNKPILFLGEIIEAGTNLVRLPAYSEPGTNSYLPILFNASLFPFAVGQIHLFREAFEIAPDDYEILFQWGNDSGEFFRDTVRVHINLNSDDNI